MFELLFEVVFVFRNLVGCLFALVRFGLFVVALVWFGLRRLFVSACVCLCTCISLCVRVVFC